MPLQHLLTRRAGQGLDITWYLGPDQSFSYFVTRTALGVAFPDDQGSGYAAVVAERVYYSRTADRLPSRFFVVIDEARTHSAADQIEALVALKDRYIAGTLYCPKEALAETLRRQEGLTHYRLTDPENRARWPTYQDDATTCAVKAVEVVPTAVRRDLDMLLSQTAADPDTGVPILDGERRLQPRLSVFAELNTKEAAGGLQPGMADEQVVTALWLAAWGLEKSRAPHPRLPFQEEGTRVTGRSGY